MMNDISHEWTPAERLQIIYGIAVELYNHVGERGRAADAGRTLHDADRIRLLARATAAFLEANRAQILGTPDGGQGRG